MMPRAKKSFGQNWLVDETVVQKILNAAEISPGEIVLEIGPGSGVLTRALMEAGAQLTAVEADSELLPALKQQFGEHLTLLEGDILQVDLRDVVKDQQYKLIANIPYNITSKILRRFLTWVPRPTRMVLMVQKEVADRVTAAPGEMSLLSVMCQLHGACRRIAKVPAGAFRPIPKVDSAILQIDYAPVVEDPEVVLKVAKIGFVARRKQLQKNLVSSGEFTKGQVEHVLEDVGLDQRVRAQELSVEDWVEVTHKLTSK